MGIISDFFKAFIENGSIGVEEKLTPEEKAELEEIRKMDNTGKIEDDLRVRRINVDTKRAARAAKAKADKKREQEYIKEKGQE